MKPSLKHLFIFSLLIALLAACAPGKISSPAPLAHRLIIPTRPNPGMEIWCATAWK